MISPHLEQLRAIRILLEAVPDGERRNDLIARARVAAATVKKIRESLTTSRIDSGKSGDTHGGGLGAAD